MMSRPVAWAEVGAEPRRLGSEHGESCWRVVSMQRKASPYPVTGGKHAHQVGLVAIAWRIYHPSAFGWQSQDLPEVV